MVYIDRFSLHVEPVEDMRRLNFNDIDRCTTPGFIRDDTMSGLRTDLTIKFDLERDPCESIRENDPERATRKMLRENENRSRSKPFVKIVRALNENRMIRCRFDRRGRFDKKLVVIKRWKKLHCNGNNFFIKITPRRYTVRSLLATTDYTRLSKKKLAILWKFVKFVLHSPEGLVSERRMILRIRDSLRKELGKRKVSRKNVFSFPRNISVRKDDKISWKKWEKPGRSDVICFQDDKQSTETCRPKASHEGIKRVDEMFSNAMLDDEKKTNLKNRKDEIDDIFSKIFL